MIINTLICSGRIRLQPPARLQFISTLCTTRCVTVVLNKLRVIKSLVYMKRRFHHSWPPLLNLAYLGLFGLRLRHHDVLGCTGCSYHRKLDELSYMQLEASSCCIVCDYCATMQVPSSDEEIIHQSRLSFRDSSCETRLL